MTLTINIEDLSIFGLYSRKENKVTAALLQVLEFGGASLLCSFISNFAYFFILPIILLGKCQLRCREPVAQLSWYIVIFYSLNLCQVNLEDSG